MVVMERMTSRHPDVYRAVHWWPAPGVGNLPATPADVSSAYEEGIRCLYVKAYRAAVVMFLAMLGQITEGTGSGKTKATSTLYAKLEQMGKDHALRPELVSWAQAIPQIGNGTAKGDPLGDVKEEDAVSLSQLCKIILEELYETPGRIIRSKPRLMPPGR